MCSIYSLPSSGVRIQRPEGLKEICVLYSVFLLYCCTKFTSESWADWCIGLFLSFCVCVDDRAEEKQAEDGLPGSNTSQPSYAPCTLNTETHNSRPLISDWSSDFELLEICLGTDSLKPLTQQISDVSRVSCLGQIPNGNAAYGLLTIKYYTCFKCHSILLFLLLAVTGEQCKSRWTSGCTSITGVTAALEVPFL